MLSKLKIVQIRNFELQRLRRCYGAVAGASLETEAPSLLKRSILIHEAFFCNGEVSANYKKTLFLFMNQAQRFGS